MATATTPAPAAPVTYGTVNIGGKSYVEREQTFPFLYAPLNSNIVNLSFILPGTSDFWLKCLTRDALLTAPPMTPVVRRFLFRLGNSDGSTWYQSGGAGGTSDLVVDSLLFGNAQFPFVLTPYIFYTANGTIKMQFQDLTGTFDYTVFFGFRGSYLIPTS